MRKTKAKVSLTVRTTVRRRIEKIHSLGSTRGRTNDALGLAASLDQDAHNDAHLNRAIYELAEERKLRRRSGSGREAVIIRLCFSDSKSNRSRFGQVLRFGRANRIHGEALARRLEKGGVRSLESEAFALRASQKIKKGKRRLRQRQLAEFQYNEGRGPFEKPKWMLLLGKLYPSGKVTVHAVVRKKKGIVRRLLAELGAEREGRKNGI